MAESVWKGLGQEPGLKIWRIENFEVKDWDPSDYGKFYSGDSYIVLNTYKDEESEALMHDVHFWIGKNSTQDEYGTVEKKTMELNAFLDDAAVLHREVQGHESALFKSYFAYDIVIMEGGARSDFKRVEPELYTKRLLHFNGKGKHVTVREDFMDVLNDDEIDVDSDEEEDEDGDKKLYKLNAEGTFDEVKVGNVSRDDFVKEDVFLLDTAKEVFVWIGSAASSEKKRNGLPRANEYMKTRAKCSTPLTIIREGLQSTTFNVTIRA